MAGRRYIRDSKGRFASRGGGGVMSKRKGLKPDKRLSEGTDQLNVRISRGDRVAMAEARRRRGSRPLKPARKDDKDQGWSIAARRYREGMRP